MRVVNETKHYTTARRKVQFTETYTQQTKSGFEQLTSIEVICQLTKTESNEMLSHPVRLTNETGIMFPLK
jgi:hypothetical protein